MTEQPDLPHELLELVAEAVANSTPSPTLRSHRLAVASAVAPMLIAHGRELEKAEVARNWTALFPAYPLHTRFNDSVIANEKT